MTKPLAVQRMECLKRIDEFFKFAEHLEKRMADEDSQKNQIMMMIKGELACNATRDSIIEMSQFESIGMAFEMSRVTRQLLTLFTDKQTILDNFSGEELASYVMVLTQSLNTLAASSLFLYWIGAIRGDYKEDRLRNTTIAVFDAMAKAEGS